MATYNHTYKNLTKKFGNVIAVNNVSLTIEPGTFPDPIRPIRLWKNYLIALYLRSGRS